MYQTYHLKQRLSLFVSISSYPDLSASKFLGFLCYFDMTGQYDTLHQQVKCSMATQSVGFIFSFPNGVVSALVPSADIIWDRGKMKKNCIRFLSVYLSVIYR